MDTIVLSCFFLFKVGKKLSYGDFQKLKVKLSEENKKTVASSDKVLHCDLGGNFMSVHASQDNILDLTQNVAEILIEMEYYPDLISRDFPSGSSKDWAFLKKAIKLSLKFYEDRKKELTTNNCTCMMREGKMHRGMQGIRENMKICDKKEEEHFFIKE
jgi:hypothetical protein